MRPITLKSAARQVADHLRTEIQRLDLNGGLPGPRTIAEQLGVNHKTVESALDLLEEEGLLISQGPGRRRKINRDSIHTASALRLHLLLHQRRDNSSAQLTEILHRLREAGHVVTVAERRVGDYLQKPAAFIEWLQSKSSDAWIIHNGPAELLQHFTGAKIPVFAIGGARQGLDIAGCGPDKTAAMHVAVRSLVELGHRRIALLARKERLQTGGGDFESAFLDELRRHQLAAGPQQVPTWNHQPSSFHRCLASLLRQNRPTALIIDEAPLFVACQQYLAANGFSAPQHLSMICMQRDPSLDWCRPAVAHFEWDSAPMLRRILQWAHHLACGKPDTKQSLIATEYVPGGTVGPAPAWANAGG